MKTCAAASCTNTSYNSPYLTWHALPFDQYIRDDWVELLGIPDDDEEMEPPKVCSTHFKATDFQANNRVLKQNVRPSLRLAKTAKHHKVDKTDMEDYVASESDEDVAVAAPKPESKEPPTPVSSRPSRKAAQRAAEKMKKYCYASPPPSPPSPGTVSMDKPSTSRASTSRVLPPAPQKSTVSPRPVPISPATIAPKSMYPVQIGKPTILRESVMKYNMPRTGINVTQIPIKPSSGQIVVHRPTPTFDKTGVNVTLQMECYEELLSPSQVSRHQKMEADVASFNQTLRTLRANNVVIIHQTDPFVKVTNTISFVNSKLTNGVAGSSSLTKTTDSVKVTPSIGVVTPQRLSTATISRQPLVLAQTQSMQILRPIAPQQTILVAQTPANISAPNTVRLTTTQQSSPQLQYKVLVDSRTGIVVGTVPQATVSASSTTQATPATTTKAVTSSAPSQSKEVEKTASSAEKPPQSKGGKTLDIPSDGSAFTIEGGEQEVNAETLLNIKAISGSYSKWCKMVAQSKAVLHAELEKENFFSEPVRWMLKMNLIVAETSCRSCTQGKYCLVADNTVQDGFKWLCNKARCAKILPVQRLYFFSRFGCSLNRLLPLVYHWAIQTDVHEIKMSLKVDIFVIRSVWRALQEVCTRAVVIKARKLGGPGKVVEVVTVKLGKEFWIIAAMERKTGSIRLKVVRSEADWNTFANLQKILEPWLMYKTVIMSPERALRGMGRIGYVFTLVDNKPPQGTNQDLIHAYNVSKYVRTHFSRMFGDFKLSEMKLDTVQGFLDELQWRNRFGKSPRESFCYIFKDIAEQSGRVVTFSPQSFVSTVAGDSNKDPPEVTLSSDSSDSSDNDVDVESNVDSPSTIPKKELATKKPLLKTYGKGSSSNPSTSTGSSSTKQKASSSTGTSDGSNSVVLDRYYYAVKNPDPDSIGNDTKGSFQFKCVICHKILDNNLKVMKHMVGHIEENRNRNPDLSDLTQCKYCFRDFDTPFSMQCHMESVHLNTNALSCQICNQAFNSAKDLSWHMRWIHVKAEMPYMCQVCNYRSSFHRDVLDHFQENHNNSDKLLCHYCLRVYNVRFIGPEQLGHLQNFYYHLYKHQSKTTTKKCNACCLVFPTPNDVKRHKAVDHVSFAKEKGVTYGDTKAGQEVIYVKDPNMKEISMTGPPKKSRPGRPPKHLTQADDDDDDSNEALADLDPACETDNSAPLVLSQDYTGMHCTECLNNIDPEHFSKCVSCSRCRYSTYCSKAFVEHMISEHSQLQKKRPSVFCFKPPALDKLHYCPCGFKSKEGNVLANHLKSCGRKTCYNDWMKAVNSLVKVEPGSEGQVPLERGSAFFPPLIVLDENEEEYVNQTLSTIPEPEPGIKPGVAGRRKRSRDSQDPQEDVAPAPAPSPVKEPSPKKACESEPPSWLNALGLVRRPGGVSASESEPVTTRSSKRKSTESLNVTNILQTRKRKKRKSSDSKNIIASVPESEESNLVPPTEAEEHDKKHEDMEEDDSRQSNVSSAKNTEMCSDNADDSEENSKPFVDDQSKEETSKRSSPADDHANTGSPDDDQKPCSEPKNNTETETDDVEASMEDLQEEAEDVQEESEEEVQDELKDDEDVHEEVMEAEDIQDKLKEPENGQEEADNVAEEAENVEKEAENVEEEAENVEEEKENVEEEAGNLEEEAENMEEEAENMEEEAENMEEEAENMEEEAENVEQEAENVEEEAENVEEEAENDEEEAENDEEEAENDEEEAENIEEEAENVEEEAENVEEEAENVEEEAENVEEEAENVEEEADNVEEEADNVEEEAENVDEEAENVDEEEAENVDEEEAENVDEEEAENVDEEEAQNVDEEVENVAEEVENVEDETEDN